LRLQDLQKVADRLGIRVSKGVTGLLTQAMFGSAAESRRSYVEALTNSDVVTLESIDRILHTRYSRLPDDTRGVRRSPRQKGVLSEIFAPSKKDGSRFYTLDSLLRHILDQYVAKSNLQKICDNLGIPRTGNKDDIVSRILSESRLTKEIVLYHVNRDNMRKLSEDMKLPAIGTRREMESRIANVMMKLPRDQIDHPRYERQQSPSEVSKPYHAAPQMSPIPTPHVISQSPGPNDGVAPSEVPSGTTITKPPEHEAIAPSTPPVSEIRSAPTIPILDEFDDILRFIDEWRPTKPYGDEGGYEVELDTRLRTRFGDTCVKNQRHVLDGRIDIEVMGVGVELKVPTNKAMLQRLVGQTMMYRKHYGPNLIVVIIAGRAKLQDVMAFKSDLELVGTRVVIKSG
jgi:hypothetical protein